MGLVETSVRSDRLRPASWLVVSLGSGGVGIPLGTAWPLAVTGAGLLLLEGLAAADGRSVGEVTDEVAVRCGMASAELAGWCGVLVEHGVLLAHEVGTESEALALEPEAPGIAVDDLGPDGLLLLEAPLLFRLGRGGFELLDHDAHVRLRCSAMEIMVGAGFRVPQTIGAALRDHRDTNGPAALDAGQFEATVARLRSAGVLRSVPSATKSRVGIQELRNVATGHDEVNQRRVARIREQRRAEPPERSSPSSSITGAPRVVPVGFDARTPPLALGLLFAQARQHASGRLMQSYDLTPEWGVDGERAREIAEQAPAVFLFSNYVWSHPYCLAISKAVKAQSRGHITIHGGPSTPKYEGDVEAYFCNNPDVDVTVRGEGEVSLAEVLEALEGELGNENPDLSVLEGVRGVSYRAGDRVVRTPDRDRVEDLDSIPSPYLTGLFDDYAEIPTEAFIIETNRGCPYGCTFCDWGSATLSRIRKFSLDRVFAELEWGAKAGFERLQIADANFGLWRRDVDIIEHIIELKEAYGYPRAVGMDFAKNTAKYLTQIIGMMTDAGIFSRGILALQSMDEQTLAAVDRTNIKLEKYEELATEFRKANLPIHVDLMMGLPGQTVTSWRNDLQQCIDREVGAILPQTTLLPNSPMNDPEYRKKYRIETEPQGLGLAAVVSTSSFTRTDYGEMERIRSVFLLCESFGILRLLSRYVRYETGLREIDFYERLKQDAVADPERWPITALTFQLVPDLMAPPVSWRLFVEELHDYLVTVCGVADDTALRAALEAQHAVLPSRGRAFPVRLELEHDFVAWHRDMIEAKESGHRHDWPTVVPPLRSYGPGVLPVDDPSHVAEYCTGFTVEFYGVPMDWELVSPVTRPSVIGKGYFAEALATEAS